MRSIRFDLDAAAPGAIRKDDDYGGYSIGLLAELGTIRLPIGIDVTFGDVITPKAERRRFRTILSEGTVISVMAYTIETLIAEKLQTILHRGTANTRPRDFYDLHMIYHLGEYDVVVLNEAVANTFKARHSEEYLARWRAIVESIAKSEFLALQWERYRRKASYASDVEYGEIVDSVTRLLEKLRT